VQNLVGIIEPAGSQIGLGEEAQRTSLVVGLVMLGVVLQRVGELVDRLGVAAGLTERLTEPTGHQRNPARPPKTLIDATGLGEPFNGADMVPQGKLSVSQALQSGGLAHGVISLTFSLERLAVVTRGGGVVAEIEVGGPNKPEHTRLRVRVLACTGGSDRDL